MLCCYHMFGPFRVWRIEGQVHSHLQNDRDVGCVEQLDWVRAVLSSVTGRLDRKVHSETL